MNKKSAGLLLYRFKDKSFEFFLVHPGGPFWKNKDAGSWSIPKGEFNEDEDALKAAKREFREETGMKPPSGKFIALTPRKQKSGKLVFAWAVEADLSAEDIKSDLFEMEWPPRSGKKQQFPEIDRAAWFDLKEAKSKILPGQLAFLEELLQLLTAK